MDSCHLNELGWNPKVNIDSGLRKTYSDYVNNNKSIQREDE